MKKLFLVALLAMALAGCDSKQSKPPLHNIATGDLVTHILDANAAPGVVLDVHFYNEKLIQVRFGPSQKPLWYNYGELRKVERSTQPEESNKNE